MPSKLDAIALESLELVKQDSDVLVDFVMREDGSWYLRASDKGIGMTSNTLQHYFLRAGASFRNSPDWLRDFIDEDDRPRIQRSGRFGIGAFATFLLGSTLRLWTRHVNADRSLGYMINAAIDSHRVEIRRVEGLPVGTTLEIDLTTSAVMDLSLNNVRSSSDNEGNKTDWYCREWPKVSRRIVRKDSTVSLHQAYAAPVQGMNSVSSDWSCIEPDGFDAVWWTFRNYPAITCNGLKIESPIARQSKSDTFFAWPEDSQIVRPRIEVADSASNLPLTIQRYALTTATLPFIDALNRDVTLSFIAHSLVFWPDSQAELLIQDPYSFPGHRLNSAVKMRHKGKGRFVNWQPCATAQYSVPLDETLFALLRSDTCVFYGTINSSNDGTVDDLWGRGVVAGFSKIPYPIVRCDTTPQQLGVDHDRSSSAGLGTVNRFNELCEGRSVLFGKDDRVLRVVLAIPRDSVYFAPLHTFWTKLAASDGYEYWERNADATDLDSSLFDLAKLCRDGLSIPNSGASSMSIVFAAKVHINAVNVERPSTLSLIWNECLGEFPIPIEQKARTALMVHARRHAELSRHIDVWEHVKEAKARLHSNLVQES